jgi:dTDP-4-dehydrorhamnose 3,5-epimerase-like enzyme
MGDIKLINGGISVDDRGSVRFVNDFNFEGVKRFYQVENHRQGFIRAYHYHEFEGKYVYVVRGSILISVVKVNKNSLDESEVETFILSSKSPKILWIPPSHANGFKNLEEDTSVIFFSTSTLVDSIDDDIRYPYDTWDVWSENFR